MQSQQTSNALPLRVIECAPRSRTSSAIPTPPAFRPPPCHFTPEETKSGNTTPSSRRASWVLLRVQRCPRPSHSVDALSRRSVREHLQSGRDARRWQSLVGVRWQRVQCRVSVPRNSISLAATPSSSAGACPCYWSHRQREGRRQKAVRYGGRECRIQDLHHKYLNRRDLSPLHGTLTGPTPDPHRTSTGSPRATLGGATRFESPFK